MYGFLKLTGLLAPMALAGTAHAQVSLSAKTSAPTGAPGTTISTLAEVTAAGGAMTVWPFPKDLFEREPAQKYINAPSSVAVEMPVATGMFGGDTSVNSEDGAFRAPGEVGGDKDMDSLRTKSIAQLLASHVAIMEELRARGVLRSANNPTGDLAEYLFSATFDWAQENNSTKAFDATGDDGTRYQIKGRRIHRRSKSRQLSAIGDLEGFDILAAVLFDDDYRILRAALIPAAVVREHSTYIKHTNSHRFMLRDAIWDAPGVIDVTDLLREVESAY